MESLEKLTNILRTETSSLKKQYLEKTKEWATSYYNLIEQRFNWWEKEWCLFLGIEPSITNKGKLSQFSSFPKGFYNTSKARELNKLQDEVRLLKKLGLEKYLGKEITKAEEHYENSIIKLATRIEKKDLDVSKLKVETTHIGVNINTTLTDGIKTVVAYTIIAQGEVQRPHYRYLIK